MASELCKQRTALSIFLTFLTMHLHKSMQSLKFLQKKLQKFKIYIKETHTVRFFFVLVSSCPTLATPWTVASQIPLSMGYTRQEYWSG